MSDEKPISVSKPHFSDLPVKKDLANDPLQGSTLLKQVNPRVKQTAIYRALAAFVF